MPSWFPGMDPYLEGPHWLGFHAAFAAEIVRQLKARLSPRYIAMLEERLVADTLEDVTITTRTIRPDVTVIGRQDGGLAQAAVLEPPLRVATIMEEEVPVHFVEIREVKSRTVVTVIEVLSPANKRGEGRADYLRKRRAILNSEVNLIEIDLLRGGERVPMREPLPDDPYFALVLRASEYPVTGVWPIGLRDRLPVIPVPLLRPDPDARLDLQAVFAGAFDLVDYSLVLDYEAPLSPPLSEEDAAWAAGVLGGRNAGESSALV